MRIARFADGRGVRAELLSRSETAGDRARELEAKVSSCELEIVPDCSHSLLTEQSALVRERALAWIQRVG